MCFVPDSHVAMTLAHFGSTTKRYGLSGDNNACLYLPRTNRDHWTGLVDLNYSPIRVLHGGTSTCLRVNFCYHVQFELMGTPRRSTSKHNLSQWFGVMPINVCFFFFCLLYEMCYFALSLLKHTFLKDDK